MCDWYMRTHIDYIDYYMGYYYMRTHMYTTI